MSSEEGEPYSKHRINRLVVQNNPDPKQHMEKKEKKTREVFYCSQCSLVFVKTKGKKFASCPKCKTQNSKSMLFVDFLEKDLEGCLFKIKTTKQIRHLNDCIENDMVSRDMFGGVDESVYGKMQSIFNGLTRELEVEWTNNGTKRLKPNIKGVEKFVKSLETYEVIDRCFLSKLENKMSVEEIFSKMDKNIHSSLLVNTLGEIGSFLMIKRNKLDEYSSEREIKEFFALLSFWDNIHDPLNEPILLSNRNHLERRNL